MEKSKYGQLYKDVVPLYIKHNRFMDVAIRLTKPMEKVGNSYIIYGKYVNQAFVETFELGVPTKIMIPVAKLHESWQYCVTPNVDCIRNAEWEQL